MKLNTENAKSFNASLKQAFKEGGMNGVKVRIINSYKFPNCWVEVWFPDRTGEFSNDFRLRVFDASGFKRESLLNASDVSYGNIEKHSISAKVWEWEKVFNNEMAKGGATIEVVGKGDKGAFRKREYEGMTEKEVSDWWESRGYKSSKNKSESKLKPYTFYINKMAKGGDVGVGGTFDSSSTGEVIGGTYGSTQSGETIGGTMASSIYAKGGLVGYKPFYLLFNDGNSATIRLFAEDYYKGSGLYTAIGDLIFGKYQEQFTMNSIDMRISSDHNAPFKLKLMAKVSQFLKDKVGSYASVQEVLGVIGGEELIVADIGRNQTTFLPKSYIGYHVFEVVQKKDGQTYTNVYAPNTLKAQKMLDEKLKERGGSGNYELHSTGDTVRNSRSEVKFKLGGNTASGYSYEIGGL